MGIDDLFPPELTRTWHQHLKAGQSDPAWYVAEGNHNPVVTLGSEGYSITVCTDGVMRAVVGKAPSEKLIQYSHEWAEHGITNDDELSDAEDAGLLRWENNAWFDLYDSTTGEWLDEVCDNLDTAVEAAFLIVVLRDPVFKGYE